MQLIPRSNGGSSSYVELEDPFALEFELGEYTEIVVGEQGWEVRKFEFHTHFSDQWPDNWVVFHLSINY